MKVAGGIDPVTGRVISREELDRAVAPVIEELDYKRLDIEVPGNRWQLFKLFAEGQFAPIQAARANRYTSAPNVG